MVRGDGGSASSTLLVRVGVELVQKAEALRGFDLVGFRPNKFWSNDNFHQRHENDSRIVTYGYNESPRNRT